MKIIFENDSFLTHGELNNPKSLKTFKIQGMKLIYLGLKSPTCLKLGAYVGSNQWGSSSHFLCTFFRFDFYSFYMEWKKFITSFFRFDLYVNYMEGKKFITSTSKLCVMNITHQIDISFFFLNSTTKPHINLLHHKFVIHKRHVTRIDDKLTTWKYGNWEWTQSSTITQIVKGKVDESFTLFI